MSIVNSTHYPQQQTITQEIARGGAAPAVADNSPPAASPSFTVTLSAEGRAMSRNFEGSEAIKADAEKQWHVNNARWEAKLERLHNEANQNHVARNRKNHAEFTAAQAENKRMQEAEVQKQAAERTAVPPPKPVPVEPPPPPPPPPPHASPMISSGS